MEGHRLVLEVNTMVERATAWEERDGDRTQGEAVGALREVLTRLERLTVAVRQELDALEGRGCGKERQDAETAEQRSDIELKKGTRVRVIRRDKYFGHTGEVMGRRGRHYVDVRLTDRPSREVIYKRRDGLEVLKG
jgi:hypothetical protein